MDELLSRLRQEGIEWSDTSRASSWWYRPEEKGLIELPLREMLVRSWAGGPSATPSRLGWVWVPLRFDACALLFVSCCWPAKPLW